MTAQRHAELGASRAHRWMHCAGSVRLCRAVPDVDTPEAIEGRRAHAMAEADLKQHARAHAPGDEMEDAVRAYVEYVQRLHREADARTGHTGGAFLRVEETFSLAALEPPGHEEMFGTADAVITGGRRLDVVDFKSGQGVIVEVEENEQLLYYVTGALVKLWELIRKDATAWTPTEVLEWALAQFDEIVVHIVQPRAFHTAGPIRSWPVSQDRVREFVRYLIFKAGATLDPDAPLHAGTWCRFCPAQSSCPEVSRYALQVARTDFAVAPPPAETLPLEVAADLLLKAGVLRHWLTSLERRVEAELRAGRAVPGWKLVNKRPSRVWNNVELLHEFWKRLERVTPDLYGDAPLKSPAQVEAIIGKKNLPQELYSYVSSGLALVPESDRRPAVATGPQEDFTALPPVAADPTEETA